MTLHAVHQYVCMTVHAVHQYVCMTVHAVQQDDDCTDLYREEGIYIYLYII